MTRRDTIKTLQTFAQGCRETAARHAKNKEIHYRSLGEAVGLESAADIVRDEGSLDVWFLFQKMVQPLILELLDARGEVTRRYAGSSIDKEINRREARAYNAAVELLNGAYKHWRNIDMDAILSNESRLDPNMSFASDPFRELLSNVKSYAAEIDQTPLDLLSTIEEALWNERNPGEQNAKV